MKKRALVTGGLGYIGSHTVVELQHSGYEVVIADDLSNSRKFILDRIASITKERPVFYCIDICDKASITSLFEKEKPFDVVIHFAASKAVGESVKEPLKYFRNNLVSLINLLECMEGKKIVNIVFSSSATVYGQPDKLPVTEATSFKHALSAYGSTKQMGEEILEKTARAKDINVISLRYFNPVGAHESALIGELPLGTPNNLIPFVTQTAAGKQKDLIVFGNDYNTPDGTCIRDYIHVVDLAMAHVKSCDRLVAGQQQNRYEVFNIGTGIGISVLEIITAFEKYNDVKLDYKIGARRPGDAAYIYANVSLAEKVLCWRAEKGLSEMVTTAWNWQQQL